MPVAVQSGAMAGTSGCAGTNTTVRRSSVDKGRRYRRFLLSHGGIRGVYLKGAADEWMTSPLIRKTRFPPPPSFDPTHYRNPRIYCTVLYCLKPT